ncbi:hypothetical protein ACH4L5_21140 [Streptomyces sp. NPDC017405]|uniref:hypothetical protein n=1 Tax=unclassified Streptomyces TaxID=2593676 RepID=UPI0037997F76
MRRSVYGGDDEWGVQALPRPEDGLVGVGPEVGEIPAIVREADGPVRVRAVGERLGLDASVRGRLGPSRARMTRLADRG